MPSVGSRIRAEQLGGVFGSKTRPGPEGVKWESAGFFSK